jgi:glutamine synthetase
MSRPGRQGTREEPLVGAIRHHLDRSGVPVEFSKGEWGRGQHEINVRYADFLEMSDRSVVFKQVCKEVAMQQGLAVTFMAKWHEDAAGNSLHLHSSLWDLDGGHSLFPGEEQLPGLPVGCTDTFRWYLGGLMAHARELALFFAPSINSYKRYQAGSFAPTGLAWAYDNRTAGFRIVGHGDGLRIEGRIPGADANPYLAFAATLAAGLDGIDRQIEPPSTFNGNIYAADGSRVPASLAEAIAEFEGSEFVYRAFGDEVVEHYLHFARTEQQLFDRVVTAWERARLFERV